jgi:chromosome partitioning protein
MKKKQKVIAVLNQKGGVGKSTLTINIAKCLSLAGHRVLIIDADPQGSTFDWSLESDKTIEVKKYIRPNLSNEIEKYPDFDFIVIDGAPRNNELLNGACAAADLIVLPLRASAFDLWASSELVEKIIAEKLRAVFVLGQIVTGTKILENARNGLTIKEIPLLKTVIKLRTIYPVSAMESKTVFDYAKGKNDPAALEIQALTDEIIKMIK